MENDSMGNNTGGIMGPNDKLLRREGEEAAISIRDKAAAIGLALSLAVMFDCLFYDKALGVSYPIFIVLLLGIFMYIARDRILFRSLFGWFLISSILLLSISFALFSNEFLSLLNFLMVPYLCVVYTVSVTDEKADWSKPGFLVVMLMRVFVHAFRCCVKPFIYIKEAVSKKGAKKECKTGRNILLGILISLPILLIVVNLLASADMAFDYFLRNFTDIFRYLNVNQIPFHIIIVSIVFMYIFGYIWSFRYSDEDAPYLFEEVRGRINSTIIITVLTVVNMVYIIFTLMQFSYLYGGAGNMLPQGLTYAQYARRGFFELVAVTIINFLILVLSLKFCKGEGKKQQRAVKVLLSLLVIFTVNILFSAHYRMYLYEESFGFTLLRIYVHMFMLLMLIFLIIAMARIWHSNIPLFKASFISAVAVFVALNYMNPDRIIAKNNVDRYMKTGKIDARYLFRLSYDALPEIIRLSGDENREVSQYVNEHLAEELQKLSRGYGWMEYNYSRHKAVQILDSYPLVSR